MSLSVSITFEFQKNDEQNDTITMHRTGDAYMCPVAAWAAVVQQILSYPGTGPTTTVNTMYDPETKEFSYLIINDLRNRLHAAVIVIGKDKLGIKQAEDIGTHLDRSGSAMDMYLAHLTAYTIMMIGWWSSNAFFRYIRKQVEMFIHNVSIRMLANEHFSTTPDYNPSISCQDLLICNNPNSFATSMNVVQGSSTCNAAFCMHT
jgi:hypothetical protein